MTRIPHLLIRLSPALVALAVAVPLGAQQAPDSFNLPEPAPSQTPTPAGPADERAGVAIPPRAIETPKIAPAPVLTPEPSPSPRPAPLSLPQPTPRPLARETAPAPSAKPSATPSPPPTQTATAAPVPETAPAPETAPEPGFGPLQSPASPVETAPAPVQTPSSALGQRVFDWPWLAGGAALLAALLLGGLAWRRRKPKVLRLAPPPVIDETADTPALPRIDLSIESASASRSVMTFTLRYRINFANRTDRAVNDLAVAVQLTSARHGGDNAAPPAAAQSIARVDRIGPHQSRSLGGEVQLPFAGIAPVMQGKTALFIPLLHVTIEGEGQQTMARSFVIGVPSGGEGRVQPLRLDTPPGPFPDLRARAIGTPPPA
jgi:hypothetical protein